MITRADANEVGESAEGRHAFQSGKFGNERWCGHPLLSQSIHTQEITSLAPDGKKFYRMVEIIFENGC